MNLKRKLLMLCVSLCCCFGISLSFVGATDRSLDVTSVDAPVVSDDGKTWTLAIHFNQTLDPENKLVVETTILSLENYNVCIDGEKIDTKGNTLTISIDADNVEFFGYWSDSDGQGGYVDDLEKIPAGTYGLDKLTISVGSGNEDLPLFHHDAELHFLAVPDAGFELENNPNPLLKDITIVVDENGRFVKPEQPSEPTIDVVETPEIIEGSHAQWTVDSSESLSFRSDASFDTFVKVVVDGQDIDASYYTVKEGSIIVTLKDSYLKTLSQGKHTIGIVSENGTAQTEFTILAKPAVSQNSQPTTTESQPTSSQPTDVKTPVATGDVTSIMPYVLLAGCAMAGYTVLKRREKGYK